MDKSKAVNTKKRSIIFVKDKSKSVKTKKRKITYSIKHSFINKLLKEWKEQTNGFVYRYQIGSYKNDYYLTFFKKGGYNNHIHLILKNFNDNHNNTDTDNKIYQMNDINKQLSNKEKMIIKRKKYEEYLNQNQAS